MFSAISEPLARFHAAARRLLPGLELNQLRPGGSGIRARSAPAEQTFSDFLIRRDRRQPRLVKAACIDSPGLTASLAIAERVADLVDETTCDRRPREAAPAAPRLVQAAGIILQRRAPHSALGGRTPAEAYREEPREHAGSGAWDGGHRGHDRAVTTVAAAGARGRQGTTRSVDSRKRKEKVDETTCDRRPREETERRPHARKYEAVYLHEPMADGFAAEQVISEWMTFYSDVRPHSALGGRTPAEAYREERAA